MRRGSATVTALAVLAVCLGGCLAQRTAGRAERSTAAGRVTLADRPLAGARVGAWSRPEFAAREPEAATRTGIDGRYRLGVPPGTWYVAVHDPDNGWFAYSGLNPLTLGTGAEAAVGFRAGRMEPPRWRERSGGAAVGGRVTAEGEPVEGARVFLYLDAGDDFRGPGFAFSLPTGADGSFLIEEVPPGPYYLTARRRRDGRMVGPVGSGDLFGFFPGNPVEAREGYVLEATIPCVVKKKPLFPSSGATLVRGTVREADGRPAAGVYVFAYEDEVVGHEKPAATTPVTGADGGYELSLPSGGTWYLGAREEYGTNPQPGERYGLYPGTPDHSVQAVGGGVLEGADIVVEEILGWDR